VQRRSVRSRLGIAALALVAACGGGGGRRAPTPPRPAWAGYARDAQHSALSDVAAADLQRIRWSRPVDLDPTYTGDTLYIHYGSPVITAANTVIFPVKTGATSGFRFDAVAGSSGASVWSLPTDYALPPHDWIPSVNACLAPSGRLYVPAAGGTLLVRADPDDAASPVTRVAFYGDAAYAAAPAAFDATVFVNTPLTADDAGNVYFGVMATGANPASVTSSLVKVSPDGAGTSVPIATHASDMAKAAHNAAPALSPDGRTVYVAVNATDGSGATAGYLLAVRAADLGLVQKVRLVDPASAADALVHDDGTASVTVGPDGDVYLGVLESPLGANHYRGWMLHFDAGLTQTKVPAAFGWDDTASIVPASMVPGYAGASAYLLMIKYNDYAEGGGDGVNRLAIVDPNASAVEPISGVAAMVEVLTVAGVTPDDEALGAHPDAVREWCVNTAAVSPATRSIVCNSEDGTCYRWNLVTNTLDQALLLAPPTAEAYTPTVIGPDGTVYAINNAILHAIGR
jgi:hypothetical protein